jgi:hypothetical protein
MSTIIDVPLKGFSANDTRKGSVFARAEFEGVETATFFWNLMLTDYAGRPILCVLRADAK